MVKHGMNYSMTICPEGDTKIIIINRKMGNDWYITAYEINPEVQYTNANKEQYKSRSEPDIPAEKSNAKTGFFIGILNLLHLIIVYMNKHNINLPEDERMTIIFVWVIITLVLAITGFFMSRKGYIEERRNSGYGIAGMALNGLVILPALLLLLSAVFSSKNDKK
jgi:cation transport ATPase